MPKGAIVEAQGTKPSFSGKDHLKILLIPSGTDTQPGSN